MKHWKRIIGALLVLLPVTHAPGLLASGNERAFAVTITNITHGEIFTPIMVASHGRQVKLFSEGTAAGPELEMLAESGDTMALSNKLLEDGALDVVTTDDVLPPGESVTVYVKTNRRNNHVSVAAMLVPTNDAFFAVNGLPGPRLYRSNTVMSPAYDAGTEFNDELCVSIPGPPFICSGEGYNAESGEGYVYIHPGIHGIGDLPAYAHDWRNPVAKITIKQIRSGD
ncbi:MAG: spondin domain-containing protein [Gammaproteobacteria bacterium]